MHDDAGLEQCVHELAGGLEVRLIRGQDVAARLAVLGPAQMAREVRGRARRSGTESARLTAIATAAQRLINRGDLARPRRPGVATALLDRVTAHRIDVVQELLATARC